MSMLLTRLEWEAPKERKMLIKYEIRKSARDVRLHSHANEVRREDQGHNARFVNLSTYLTTLQSLIKHRVVFPIVALRSVDRGFSN